MSLATETGDQEAEWAVDEQKFDLHQYTYLPDSAVYGISGKAFDLIHQNAMPPDPISYAVWFAYASNSNIPLKQKVDARLRDRGAISRQEIALIYRNYLEDSFVADSQQNLGLELETNLADITSAMDKCATVYGGYTDALNQAKSRLATAETQDAISAIAKEMLAESEKVSEVTANLQADLKESRAHIEHLNQKLEDLQNLSVRDPLTGARNRRAFDTHLKKQIEIAKEEGTPLSVAFADLDHFKRVNDQLGHQVGDVVLKYFASMLINGSPSDAIIARYGGEEFALILPGLKKFSAHNLAIKLCDNFRREQFLAKSQHELLGQLTASFGVSSFKPGRGSYELLEMADKKLYDAKKDGRNCVRTEGIS